MTSSISVSAALLRTRLVSGACRDEELAKAYETGEAHTRKAAPRRAGSIGRLSNRFIPKGPRARPVSPDKEASRRRKRIVGGPSELPENIRQHYTHGEQAALAIVVREVMDKGCCDLCIDQIAAEAGISRTTVQNALRRARDENAHVDVEVRPVPGQKNLTNVIRIISKEWVDWLKRRIGFKKLSTTKISSGRISLSEFADSALRALEKGEEARAVPNRLDGALGKPVSSGNGSSEPKRSGLEHFRTSVAMAGGWV